MYLHKTLVINNNNPIIKKIIELKDDESKKDQMEMICKQVVDLALIGNNELKADELDGFIKRSNNLMKLVLGV